MTREESNAIDRLRDEINAVHGRVTALAIAVNGLQVTLRILCGAVWFIGIVSGAVTTALALLSYIGG